MMAEDSRFKGLADGLDATRKAVTLIIIVVTFVAAAFWPEFVGARLDSLRITKFAGVERSLEAQTEYVKGNLGALNTIQAKRAVSVNDQTVQAILDDVAQSLTKAISPQVAALNRLAPGTLQETGWAYLGTRSLDNSKWLHSGHYYTTIGGAWPLQVGTAVTFSRDTNLHEDSAPEDRKYSQIRSVIPLGTKAIILQLDENRQTNDGGETGLLVWALVNLQR